MDRQIQKVADFKSLSRKYLYFLNIDFKTVLLHWIAYSIYVLLMILDNKCSSFKQNKILSIVSVDADEQFNDDTSHSLESFRGVIYKHRHK